MAKKNQVKLALVIFFVVAILDIVGIIMHSVLLRTIFKPLVMLSLALYYLSATKKNNIWYLVGIFFSFLEDVFLLNSGEFYFILGLASFLLAHIVYIKITNSFINRKSISKITVTTLPFIAFFIVFLFLLKDYLSEMLLPVIVYGIVISIFGMVTTLNYSSYKSKANLWLLLGALFFILSDSILAVNKFYSTKEVYGLTVMVTYIIAQFFICKAMILKDSPLSTVK